MRRPEPAERADAIAELGETAQVEARAPGKAEVVGLRTASRPWSRRASVTTSASRRRREHDAPRRCAGSWSCGARTARRGCAPIDAAGEQPLAHQQRFVVVGVHGAARDDDRRARARQRRTRPPSRAAPPPTDAARATSRARRVAGHDDERPARASRQRAHAHAALRPPRSSTGRPAVQQDGIDILRVCVVWSRPCASLCRHYCCFACAGCNNTSPLEAALPSLPPEGGAALAAAGRLTRATSTPSACPGPASQGLVGDYFMRNDKVRMVVQAPDRAIGPCPFGGNVIDADCVDAPAGDQLGEVSAFLQLGRTFAFDRAGRARRQQRRAGGAALLRPRRQERLHRRRRARRLRARLQDDYRADVDLKLQRRRHLHPHAGRDQAAHHLHHVQPEQPRRGRRRGARSPTPARSIELFHPVAGFGEADISAVVSGGTPPGRVRGAAQRAASPTASCRSSTTRRRRRVPVAGVDVEVYGVAESVGRARRQRAVARDREERHGHARGRSAGWPPTSPT